MNAKFRWVTSKYFKSSCFATMEGTTNGRLLLNNQKVTDPMHFSIAKGRNRSDCGTSVFALKNN